MDDLQNLGIDSVDSQVNSALGYSPKSSQSASPKYSDFDVNKTYGTPARLLDNLNQTESSGNPYAVNKDSKALGGYQFLPETVSELHKNGAKFNVFDEKESRAAADYQIQKYVQQNGGDYTKAIAQYGGFKKADPTQYLAKVMNGVDLGKQQTQQPQQTQVQQVSSNDPLSNLSGGSIDLAVQGALKENKVAPQPAKVINPNADIPTDVGVAPTAVPVQPTASLPAYKLALKNINVGNKDSIENKYVTPAIEAGVALATGATTGLLSGIISTLTPASKQYIDAERKTWQAQNPDLPYNRFEQAFIKGVQAGTLQPKTEGGKQAISAVSDVLSSLPPTLPGELGALSAEREAGIIKPGLKAEAPIATEITPTAARAAQAVSTDTPTYLRKQFAEKQAREQPVQAPVETTPQVAAENVAPSNIAKVHNPDENYQNHEYTEQGLPPEEVQARMELADRTAPGLKSDKNVFEGRGRQRADDYALSLTNSPEGHLMADQLAREKQAQVDYGNKLIDQTGGTRGLDESNNYKRGETVIKPLEDLSNEFDRQIKELYTKRDEQASNIPVVANKVKDILNTESEVQGHEATVNLAHGANARLRELGMMDKDGNMLPSTALQSEKFRQYLNRKWTSQNAPLNAMLKNAIDNDVFENAGEVIHKDARALVEARKNTLENPKGIASILDSSGPSGINRKVATEKIADTITNMPVDQFEHIIKTLDSVPDSLKTKAQAAKSEIKAHFLNKAEAEFNKGANTGTKYLNSNREVFNRLFTPKELSAINDRNAMAHLYKTDTGYKGSGVQTHNLAKRGIGRAIFEQTIQKGGALAAEATTGGASGGMAGLGTHHALSSYFEKGAAKRELKAQVKSARQKESGFTSLSDIAKKSNKNENDVTNFKAK